MVKQKKRKTSDYIIGVLAVIMFVAVAMLMLISCGGSDRAKVPTETFSKGEKWEVVRSVNPYDCGFGLSAGCDKCRKLNGITLKKGTVLYRAKDSRIDTLDCSQGTLLRFKVEGVEELQYINVYISQGAVAKTGD